MILHYYTAHFSKFLLLNLLSYATHLSLTITQKQQTLTQRLTRPKYRHYILDSFLSNMVCAKNVTFCS